MPETGEGNAIRGLMFALAISAPIWIVIGILLYRWFA
jgi:hypothetical protein